MARLIYAAILAMFAATAAPIEPPTGTAANPPNPMILQQDEGDQLVHRAGPLKGVPFTVKVDRTFGRSEDFFVFSEMLGPGQTIPFHKHENAEEILVFEEAGADVIVGKEHRAAGPQAIVFIPRDTWISATNTSAKPIHTLAIFSRHGFEDYMRAISVKPGEPLIPLSPEELTRVALPATRSTGTLRKDRIRRE